MHSPFRVPHVPRGCECLARIPLEWNYYRCMWMFATICSVLGAIGIYFVDDLPFIDCLFLSVSAYTGSGLSPVGMQDLSDATFAILFVLMFLGGTVFLLILPMIWRIQSFRRLEPQIETVLSSIEHLNENTKVKNLLSLVSSRRAQVRGLQVVLGVTCFYLVLWIVGGWLAIWLAISRLDPLPELAQRGFSNAWVAAFTNLSAFGNVGLTFTSDSLKGWNDAPSVYLTLIPIILAGNNAAPILLRCFVRSAHSLGSWIGIDRDAARFALDHPREMTTHLFDKRQTKILALLLLGVNVVQYVLFLGATMPRPFAPDNNERRHVAGAGLCQTVSTRMAGFEIVSLRELNQGLIVVFMAMMYLSTAPFVSRMYVSEQTFDDSTEGGSFTKTNQSAEHAKHRFNSLFLFRHLSWLLITFTVIAFVEDRGPKATPADRIPLFSVLFEIISAYGNVGLSLGHGDAPLSGVISVWSKLLLISVMMLGKHRGLPAVSDITLNFQYVRLRKALQLAHVEHRRGRAAGELSHISEESEMDVSVVRRELGIESPRDRKRSSLDMLRAGFARLRRSSGTCIDSGGGAMDSRWQRMQRGWGGGDRGRGGGVVEGIGEVESPSSPTGTFHTASPGEDNGSQGTDEVCSGRDEDGARSALSETPAVRIVEMLRSQKGGASDQFEPPSADKDASQHRRQPGRIAEAWKGVWTALWNPDADCAEAERRVQAWELIRTDPLITNILSSPASGPSYPTDGARPPPPPGMLRRVSTVLFSRRRGSLLSPRSARMSLVGFSRQGSAGSRAPQDTVSSPAPERALSQAEAPPPLTDVVVALIRGVDVPPPTVGSAPLLRLNDDVGADPSREEAHGS